MGEHRRAAVVIGLTRGQVYAAAVIVAIAVGALLYFAGRSQGAAAAKTAADEAAERKVHAAMLVVQSSADSLERITRSLTALSAKAAAVHEATTPRTDTALVAERAARQRAEQLARDSSATLEQLRAAALELARNDSILEANLLTERSAAARRIMLTERARDEALATIEKKNDAIRLAGEDRTKLLDEISDLKNERHGVVHRAFTGVVTLVAAAGCGGLGSLAGPAVAVGAAIACAGVVGAIAP